MKKYLSILLIALMMFTVLFVSISCKDQPSEPKAYVVTYDSQGGSKVAAVSVEPGAVSNAPTTNPTRSNYVFIGWYDDAACTVVHDFAAAVKSDITIYAKWQDKTSYEHSDPNLPKGTGATVPTWEVASNGWSAANNKTDLPAFVTDGSTTNVTDELKAALASVDQSFFDETPNKVIVIISDGMGVNQLQISREYKGELIMDLLPYYTYSLTDSYYKLSDIESEDDLYKKYTTDSCAGGTQILSGYKTRYAFISTDINQNPVKNLSELAKEQSPAWKVGVTTNDWVTDATPADTYGHAAAREVGDLLGFQAIYRNTPDLLMGGGSFSNYFSKDYDTWAERLLVAEKDAMDDCLSKEFSGTEKSTLAASLGQATSPIAWYKNLNAEQKAKVERYSVYYYIWKEYTNQAMAYTTWAESKNGLAKFCTELDDTYGKPSDKITRKTFKQLTTNTDFSKPLFNLWSSVGGNDYDSAKPGRGYLLSSKSIPNFCEMVAYTLYQMDKEAAADNTGFFCMIENTCTDGWGHSENESIKREGTMNEVQCTDEGVAIAVKYVLEHPDTLLIVTADHETGGYTTREGWETDFSKIKSTTHGHSSQPVPCIAFGAGADRFSATAIAEAYPNDSSMNTSRTYDNKDVLEHEGWITGQIIGQLMGDADFGQPAGYPNN